MGNRASALLALLLIVVVALGCSAVNPFTRSKEQPHSNTEPRERSTTDKAVGAKHKVEHKAEPHGHKAH